MNCASSRTFPRKRAPPLLADKGSEVDRRANGERLLGSVRINKVIYGSNLTFALAAGNERFNVQSVPKSDKKQLYYVENNTVSRYLVHC